MVTFFWICLSMISHFTFHTPLEVLCYNWSLLKVVKVLYVYVYQSKRTNQSCSPSTISQSLNVEWRTSDRNCKQFIWWKQEKSWSFDKTRNSLIGKKIMIRVVKNIFPLDFTKYLSYLELQKRTKFLMLKQSIGTDFW